MRKQYDLFKTNILFICIINFIGSVIRANFNYIMDPRYAEKQAV